MRLKDNYQEFMQHLILKIKTHSENKINKWEVNDQLLNQ